MKAGEQRARHRWRRGEEQLDDEPVGEQERLIQEALVDLRERDVREVMTPRVDVAFLTIPVGDEDIVKAVRMSGHSAFPVVHGDLDDVVGVLFVNDLLQGADSTIPGHPSSTIAITRRIREPFVIPETTGVLEALGVMRRQRRGFAIVVDEYGGVAGVLTVKDLLEPLVGDLHDELDRGWAEPDIVRIDGSRWLVDGGTSIDEARQRLEVAIPDGDYVTLAGWVLDVLGHIPEEGERVEAEGWQFEVVEMEKRRIVKVVARRALSEAD